MYKKLKNSRIKIVFSDGSGWGMSQGILTDYNEELQTLIIHDEKKGHDIYINAKKIHKLEVLQEHTSKDMGGDII